MAAAKWQQAKSAKTDGQKMSETDSSAVRKRGKKCKNSRKRAKTGAKVPGEKKAHKHKLFALVNVQMALGQMAGCPRVNRAKKFMCSPRNPGNINFFLWLAGGLSQGCPDFQKVYYVFKVYVPSSCPKSAKTIGCFLLLF